MIKSSQLNTDILNNSSIPIVLYSPTQRVKEIIADCHYYEFSLNIMLAEALAKKNAATRHQLVNDEILKIVTSARGSILLTDYEMLFDPLYGIDVIKLFYEISRRTKIVVMWCGTMNESCLEYATPEYAYTGTSGRRIRRHPDSKPALSGHLVNWLNCTVLV